MSIFQDKRTDSRKKEFPSLPSNRTDCDGLSIEEIIKWRVWVSKSDLKTWVSKYEIKLETLRSRGDHFKSITSVSVPYFGKHYPWTICQITDVLYLNIVLLLKKAQVQEARLLYSWTQFLMNCFILFSVHLLMPVYTFYTSCWFDSPFFKPYCIEYNYYLYRTHTTSYDLSWLQIFFCFNYLVWFFVSFIFSNIYTVFLSLRVSGANTYLPFALAVKFFLYSWHDN